MSPYATSLFQHRGDPGQRPEIVEESVGLSPLNQKPLQLSQMGAGDLGGAPQRAALPRGLALPASRSIPAQCRCPAHFAPAGHFGLAASFGQQLHAFASSLFELIEIPSGRLCCNHAHRLERIK